MAFLSQTSASLTLHMKTVGRVMRPTGLDRDKALSIAATADEGCSGVDERGVAKATDKPFTSAVSRASPERQSADVFTGASCRKERRVNCCSGR